MYDSTRYIVAVDSNTKAVLVLEFWNQLKDLNFSLSTLQVLFWKLVS